MGFFDATLTYVNQKTNTLGQVTTTTYNTAYGKIASMVPPYLQACQGPNCSFTSDYDALGRIHQENRPDGGYTAYQYLSLGSPTAQYVQQQEHIVGGYSVIDHYTWTYLDGLGRAYHAYGTGPNTAGTYVCTDTVYDTVGRVSSKTVPYLSGNASYSTTYTYDGLSRVTNTNIPDVNNVSYNIAVSYQGLTKVVTDQNGHKTTSTSDVFGRLKSVTDDSNTTTQYTYDTRNNLLQVVAASNLSTYTNTTTMTYDSMGRKLTMNDPDMGAWTYSYDKGGNLRSQTDAKSQTINFAYDPLNRVLTKTYSDHAVNYAYDTPPVGVQITCPPSVPSCTVGTLVSTTTNLNGETESDLVLAFDIMQRVTLSQKNIGGTSMQMGKTYDSAGRTYQLTYYLPPGPTQQVYTYAYDPAGNLLSPRRYEYQVHRPVLYLHCPRPVPIGNLPETERIGDKHL